MTSKTTIPTAEINDENIALATAAMEGAKRERDRIVAMLKAEAREVHPQSAFLVEDDRTLRRGRRFLVSPR